MQPFHFSSARPGCLTHISSKTRLLALNIPAYLCFSSDDVTCASTLVIVVHTLNVVASACLLLRDDDPVQGCLSIISCAFWHSTPNQQT